jgi:hypothetical protein
MYTSSCKAITQLALNVATGASSSVSFTEDAHCPVLHEQRLLNLRKCVESSWLPQALAIHDQIMEGETLSDSDRQTILQFLGVFDKAIARAPEDSSLSALRQGMAQLCDDILTASHRNVRSDRNFC